MPKHIRDSRDPEGGTVCGVSWDAPAPGAGPKCQDCMAATTRRAVQTIQIPGATVVFGGLVESDPHANDLRAAAYDRALESVEPVLAGPPLEHLERLAVQLELVNALTQDPHDHFPAEVQSLLDEADVSLQTMIALVSEALGLARAIAEGK